MIQLDRLFTLYNFLHRKKEVFEPLHPDYVGLYVCGPTVYGSPHLGHARSALVFDLLYRVLKAQGYRIRYVRNITDVGHLEDERNEDGEDKIIKQAKIEQRLPIEIAQVYTREYHKMIDQLGCIPPAIEPMASGTIPEQISYIESIIHNGFAYVTNGSVYFDVHAYAKKHNYGVLSGMKIEGMLEGVRAELTKQQEKRSPLDFALWKKADGDHMMQWQSPWGSGFPGWHIECSAMGQKFLGTQFDIHGGGIDLQFPHHEAEIAQSIAAGNGPPVRYWVHHNLLTVETQKMSKSKGNFVTVDDFFSGENTLFGQAYSPLLLRFFFLRTHYRSVVEISADALTGAREGLVKLLRYLEVMQTRYHDIKPEPFELDKNELGIPLQKGIAALLDDLNTPKLLAELYASGEQLTTAKPSPQTRYAADVFAYLVQEVLGLQEKSNFDCIEKIEDAIERLLELRGAARSKKDYVLSDHLRDVIQELGYAVEDKPDGTSLALRRISH